jgi:hypothetical protein
MQTAPLKHISKNHATLSVIHGSQLNCVPQLTEDESFASRLSIDHFPPLRATRDPRVLAAGNYTVRMSGLDRVILKQFLGDLHLHGNGSIHLRSFGQFNLTLWDNILAEFEATYGKLTSRDIIMFNFGAWYACRS